MALADVLILSKVDLVEPFDLVRFDKRLNGLNASARRILADHGRVPVGTLFGLSAMREGVTSSDVDAWLGMAQNIANPDPLAGLSGVAVKPFAQVTFNPAMAASHHLYDHRIISASVVVEVPISANVFDFWLDTLIALKGSNILRMKGIVHVEGLDFSFVFHGVQHIFDAPVPLESWAGEGATSRVVVIARDMDQADLKFSLDMLSMRPQRREASDNLPSGMMVETIELPF